MRVFFTEISQASKTEASVRIRVESLVVAGAEEAGGLITRCRIAEEKR